VKPEVVLIGVTILWGSTFAVTKAIVREAPPLVYLTFRFGVASALMAALYFRRFPRSRRALRDGAILGLLNSAGLTLQVFGQVYTTASKSAFITSLNTPLVPLFGYWFYKARPTRPQLAAVAIATSGLFLLTWPGWGARWNRGDLLTVGCAVWYAFTIVEIARRTPHHDALGLTIVQLGTAAGFFCVLTIAAHAAIAAVPPPSLPEALLLEARPLVVDSRLLGEGLYMAVVCSVVTFSAQTWAMARMTATHAAVVFALEPVFATMIALAWDGSAEWPGARGATGAALVLVAVAVSEIGRKSR
jgi:drug/metabolite transporter (DMT)-like permease